jgi:membrane protease YdiL (CAAX protease family)
MGAMKPWGYWATLGWTVLAFVAGQVVSLVVLVLWRDGDLTRLLATPYDGITVTLIILVSNPIAIALIALAVRLARCEIAEYLALAWPPRPELLRGIASLAVVIAVCDAALYLTGHALVTPFQLESYTSAAAEGWLPAMWIAAVIIAPAGEEVMFRGFLYRGWARSERLVWPAILAISLVWSALHVQYDWLGMLQIFVVGLFLGWLRWRSGSTVLTFILHALFNLEGTIETVVQVHFLQ